MLNKSTRHSILDLIILEMSTEKIPFHFNSLHQAVFGLKLILRL